MNLYYAINRRGWGKRPFSIDSCNADRSYINQAAHGYATAADARRDLARIMDEDRAKGHAPHFVTHGGEVLTQVPA